MLGRIAKAYLEWRGLVVSKRPDYFYDESPFSTFVNHDFLDDPRFQEAIRISRETPFAQRGFHQGRWNFHVIFWATQHAIALKSDIVHLGVFEGACSAASASFTDFARHPDSRMYLVDTFYGNPEELWTADERAAGADAAQWAYKEAGDTYEMVKRRFAPYPNVEVVRGRVPEILPSIGSRKIGFLYLDLNCAAPERAAAEYLWPSIVPGGIVMSDDYGHSREGHGYYAQKLAFDEFAASKCVPVLNLPTGHGMILKP